MGIEMNPSNGLDVDKSPGLMNSEVKVKKFAQNSVSQLRIGAHGGQLK